jgi:hypothetical protein
MKNYDMIKLSVLPGSDIDDIIVEAIHMAKDFKATVLFNFNGVKIKVNEAAIASEVTDFYIYSLKYSAK